MGSNRFLLLVLVGTLALCGVYGQDNETESCSLDSCDISSCDPGFELDVSVDSSELVIGCSACPENYFKAEDGIESCEACPDGLVSESGASTCTLESGYWRTSNTSLEVYECVNEDACLGGSDPSSYCASGYEGPLCAVCEGDYYPSSNSQCLSCTDANSASTIVTLFLFFLVLGILLVMVVKAGDHLKDYAEDAEVDEAAHDTAEDHLKSKTSSSSGKIMQFVRNWMDTLLVRFKVLVAHFQIVATFPDVMDVQWPEAFNRYADKFSVFNLDIWGILSQGCFFRPDFLKQLLFTTLLPLAVVACLMIYHNFLRKKLRSEAAKRAAWDQTAGAILLTGFFFYILTSTLVLKTFNCQEFDDGTSFLKADYDISCDSTRYKVMRVYAGIMCAVFPVGIPATYLGVLYVARSRINPDPHDQDKSSALRATDPTVQKTKFLWGTYRPAVFYYEVWECIRKLLLTGLLVYFEEGTSTQVVIAILITLTGLRVLSGLQPYKREDENTLAEMAFWVTFLTLFAGLLIKSGVTSEDGYDVVALGIIMSAMNVALLALAAFQLVWASSVWFHDTLCDWFGLDLKMKPVKQRRGRELKSSNRYIVPEDRPTSTPLPDARAPKTGNGTRAPLADMRPQSLPVQKHGVQTKRPNGALHRGSEPQAFDNPIRTSSTNGGTGHLI